MDLVPFLYYVFVENQAIGDVFLQHHAINIFLKNIIIASRDFHNLDKKISSDIFKIIETENNNERLMNHLAAFISTNFAKPNTPSTLVKSATDDKPIPTTTTSATTTTASFFNPAAPAPLDEKEDVQRLAL